jgi:hypothetical protein
VAEKTADGSTLDYIKGWFRVKNLYHEFWLNST